MGNEEPSGQQAVDIEAALRWADRHEARERQKLRDMGLPPEGDMPVAGAFFVRGLVAMLRTAAPTAPGTADAVSVPRAMLAPFITEASNWADSVPDDYRAPCAEPGKTHVYPGSETAYTVGDLRRLAAHCSAAPSTAAGEPALVCGCGWEGSYADLNETAEGMTCPKCRLGRNLDCAAALATPPAQHTDDVAVDRFAVAMKEKLKHAREVKGRGGWQNCDPFDLSVMLRDHVEKGDPLDVANFCMMLWSLGCNIERLATPPAQEVEEETETLENLIDAAIGARTAPPWQEQAAQIRRQALEEAAKVCDQRAKTAVSHMGATDVPSHKEAFARDAEEAEDCAYLIRALLSKPAKGEG